LDSVLRLQHHHQKDERRTFFLTMVPSFARISCIRGFNRIQCFVPHAKFCRSEVRQTFLVFEKNGRGEWIRIAGLRVPNQILKLVEVCKFLWFLRDSC
jgi:hypothetical protein